MITLILVLIFGVVGGAFGEFVFDQHCIIGTAIGAFLGILVRLGGDCRRNGRTCRRV